MEREDKVYMAKICEEADRYEDMVGYIKKVAFKKAMLCPSKKETYFLPPTRMLLDLIGLHCGL